MKPEFINGRAWAVWVGILLFCIADFCDAAEGSKTDKSQFNLFHPTPAELMREMSPDRPDLTEGPFTIDAGHFQIEMDVVNYTRDHDRSAGNDTVTSSWAIAPMNLKVGILDDLDFHLILGTYNYVTTKDRVAGTTTRQQGFNGITTRLKLNLWGNEGGSTASALLPYVKFPVNQDGLGGREVEGGMILPLAVELGLGWEAGLMTKLDVVQDSGGSGHHIESVNSVTVGHAILGTLAGYAEFATTVSAERNSPWIGTVDVGLTYSVAENVQLDAGVNLGVTRSAPDVNPFLGISVRF